MRRVILFAEDYAHETFISALVNKLANDCGINLDFIVRSARGGHDKAVSEFASYLKTLPLLGGIEYAQDIVNNMNIQRAMNADVSFKKFIADLSRKFSEWRR